MPNTHLKCTCEVQYFLTVYLVSGLIVETQLSASVKSNDI
jgi:hypothetical protein